jgi:hypothetical protein
MPMTHIDFELYICGQMMPCDSPAPHAEILALFDFDSRTVAALVSSPVA